MSKEDETGTKVDRDFNLERPKTFRIRDQTFRIVTVRPEAYAESLRHAEEVESAEDTKLEDMWGLRDERILLSIHPDEHARWHELRARTVDGIELADMNAILTWLTEVHTGRPTLQAEPSSPGPGNTGQQSTVKSSSTAATPAG